MKKRLVIFASGNGTNTQNIINYFATSQSVEVVCVLSNKKDAKVLERAKTSHIKALSFSKTEMVSPDGLVNELKSLAPDLIILAGFLLKFPEIILREFQDKVINIHPALLPKYGGKGMYGKHVHEAIVANKEPETGITIHYVNEKYDDGAIIFQTKTEVLPDDSANVVASKVHKLEHEWFPKIIEEVLNKSQKTLNE